MPATTKAHTARASTKGKQRADVPRAEDDGAHLDADEGAENEKDDGYEGAASPHGLKRVRVNEAGDGLPVKDEPYRRVKREALVRDTDGCVSLSFFAALAHL